jgi:transcriptional antiterminator NusG
LRNFPVVDSEQTKTDEQAIHENAETQRPSNLDAVDGPASLDGPAEANISQGDESSDSPAAPVADDGFSAPISPEDYVSPADLDDREDVKPLEEIAVSEDPANLEWYILKVQVNREDSIADALRRRVKIEGLDRFFGEIIVPTEMVSEVKAGKKKIFKRKLYPGYIVVQMEINDDTWFLVRETSGIGDFTGTAGKPAPMSAQDVAKIVQKQEEKTAEQPKLKINFQPGDRAKIIEGTFENFEGEVETIDEANGRVNVIINIFGRSTPVELEYWQIEKL